MGAAVGLGVAGLGALASAFGQASANRAQRDMAREQMAFQERMSNTQYQRAMADMRAAGLNPMLAYMQGGAGNVSGAFGSQESVVPDVGRLTSSALDAARFRKEMALLDAQAEATKRQGENQGAQAQWTQTRNLIDQAVADPAFDRGQVPLLTVAWRRAMANSSLAQASLARSQIGERTGRSALFGVLTPWLQSSARGMQRLQQTLDPAGRRLR